MVEWHHQLNGHEFEQAPEDSEGLGSLAYCSSCGHKESDMTEWLNNSMNRPRCRPAMDSNNTVCYCYLVVQSCITLFDPMDFSPPGSSVHGILQAISSSRRSSQPTDWTCVSCTAGRFTPLSHLGSPMTRIGFCKCAFPAAPALSSNHPLYYYNNHWLDLTCLHVCIAQKSACKSSCVWQ